MSEYPIIHIGKHDLTLAKPDFNHPRIDLIVYRTNDVAGSLQYQAITGTPAERPVAPQCPADWFAVTAVQVPPREPLCRVQATQLGGTRG